MKTIFIVFIALTTLAQFSAQAEQDTNVPKIDSAKATTLQSLNKAQIFLVRQFRIQNIQYLTDDYLRSDNHIIGLLRASQWKIATASKFLKKILTWRSLNNMDKLGETEADAGMLTWFPYRIDALTRDGCPVLEVDAGEWQFADFMESTEYVRDALKVFTVHEAQMVEKARSAVKKLSSKCDQAVVLADLTGFDMRNIAEPNAISVVIKVSTDAEIHYANLFESIIFINTPPEFMNIITILKTYMGQTGKVISVYSEEDGEEAQKKVDSFIDPVQLMRNHSSKLF